jgi:hypothetical protein
LDVGLEIHFSASSHLDGVGREKGGSKAATAADLFTVGGPDELLSESKLSSSGARFLDLWPLLLDISVEVEHSKLPVDNSTHSVFSIRELVLSRWSKVESCMNSSMIGQAADLLRSSSSPESLASGDVSSPLLRWCFSSPRSIARSLAGENPPDWDRRTGWKEGQKKRFQ